MNSNNNMIELQMELPIEHEKKVFGQFDEHIKILERSLAVTLISRDGRTHVGMWAWLLQRAQRNV